MSILLAPMKMIVDFIVSFYGIIEQYFPVLILSCLIILCATLAFRYFILPLIAENIRLNDVKINAEKREKVKTENKIKRNENERYAGGKPKQG